MSNLNHTFYKKSFQKHGISAKGVHWNSKRNQYIRFEVLTSFIKGKIKNSSILDVGCGFAEYIEFLKIKDLEPKEYLGIDCESFMIEESKKRFKNNNFLVCNILKDKIPKKDYIVCSGTFNILNKEDFFRAIENCYKSCNRGLLFNFLTKDSFTKIKEEEITSFCKNISNKVHYSNPYLPNDKTIFLEK